MIIHENEWDDDTFEYYEVSTDDDSNGEFVRIPRTSPLFEAIREQALGGLLDAEILASSLRDEHIGRRVSSQDGPITGTLEAIRFEQGGDWTYLTIDGQKYSCDYYDKVILHAKDSV